MAATSSPLGASPLLRAQVSARNATFGKIELQYDLLVEENNKMEAMLKKVCERNFLTREQNQKKKKRLYSWHQRLKKVPGISQTAAEAVRLRGSLDKLKFRSPRYRPGHTSFVPSNPTGVPITGPRATMDRVVYSNWARTHRFPSEKVTPGPSDYNPNYNNPNEQYVYVKRVQPYGTREVVDEDNVREKRLIKDLFQRTLALPTSPIKIKDTTS